MFDGAFGSVLGSPPKEGCDMLDDTPSIAPCVDLLDVTDDCRCPSMPPEPEPVDLVPSLGTDRS